MGEIVANSLRGRRAAHQNFGLRRCENIVALQNVCVELLARAMPKTHTSNVEHAQDFAKICINDARNCCRFFAMSARGTPNFAFFLCRESDGVRAHFKRWALGPTLRPPLPPYRWAPAPCARKKPQNLLRTITQNPRSFGKVCMKFARSLCEIKSEVCAKFAQTDKSSQI